MYGSDKVLLSLVTNLDPLKYKPMVLLPYHGNLCVESEKKAVNIIWYLQHWLDGIYSIFDIFPRSQ